MKVKEESEKVGLKLNIQKTKIMASGPITSWQIDEEMMGKQLVEMGWTWGRHGHSEPEGTMCDWGRGRGTRDQSANIGWIIKKAREFQKSIYFCFVDYAKAFDCVDYNKLWKILKEMGITDHLTCLLRNLYAGQEATVRTGHGTTDWFQIGKGVRQGCMLSPCLFHLYAEYIMGNAGLKKHKQESRLLGEIPITSDMQMTPPLWQKVKRNSKAS